jgi:hypothetical protein
VVQGAGDDRVETIVPAAKGGGEAGDRTGPSLPEAASPNVVPDEQGLPIAGTKPSASQDAKSATRPKNSLAALATAILASRAARRCLLCPKDGLPSRELMLFAFLSPFDYQ